jgi:hypothetical protein
VADAAGPGAMARPAHLTAARPRDIFAPGRASPGALAPAAEPEAPPAFPGYSARSGRHRGCPAIKPRQHYPPGSCGRQQVTAVGQQVRAAVRAGRQQVTAVRQQVTAVRQQVTAVRQPVTAVRKPTRATSHPVSTALHPVSPAR